MPDLVKLFDELVRFETELWNGVESRLRADFDLPLSWFEPMRVISRRPSCRVYDIAAELSITVGGTSKLVDRIEAAGHCRRRANPGDRRSSIIELSPAGRRLLTEATAAFEDELRVRLATSVSDRSLQQFTATLVKLRSAPAVNAETPAMPAEAPTVPTEAPAVPAEAPAVPAEAGRRRESTAQLAPRNQAAKLSDE